MGGLQGGGEVSTGEHGGRGWRTQGPKRKRAVRGRQGLAGQALRVLAVTIPPTRLHPWVGPPQSNDLDRSRQDRKAGGPLTAPGERGACPYR